MGFEPVAWFNGGLFDDDVALPLEREEIAAMVERAKAARTPAVRTRRLAEAERRLRAFLQRLREFTVLVDGTLLPVTYS